MNRGLLLLSAAILVLGASKSKGNFNISALSQEEQQILHEHFAIPAGKKIPKTYLSNEMKRYSVLPAELRSENQKLILSILTKCVT